MSKVVPGVIFIMFLLFAALSAKADILTCGGKVFTDAERFGASKGEIRDACGDPQEDGYTHWVYIQDGTKYLLTFGGNGLLTNVQSGPAR